MRSKAGTRTARRKVFRHVLGACVAAAGVFTATRAPAQQPLRSEYDTFIEEVSAKHGLDRVALRRLFAQVKPQPSIIRFMSTPGTSRPWYEFRKGHVDTVRINGGVKFWLRHEATLARAAHEFGVPEEIVVATIGIETIYGSYTGNFKILDALATLAFDYPKRAEFFRGELEEFLLLGREAGIDLAGARGSYAGAMGVPQFLPSSYRKYAVDFDGDGQRNLWNSMPDVIGSVANYYRSFEWRAGEAVVVPAQISATPDDALMEDITPTTKIAEFRKYGIQPASAVNEDMEAALIPLETESGMQYWFGLKNFYVITRYNRSTNYAMSVYELAREIRSRVKGN